MDIEFCEYEERKNLYMDKKSITSSLIPMYITQNNSKYKNNYNQQLKNDFYFKIDSFAKEIINSRVIFPEIRIDDYNFKYILKNIEKYIPEYENKSVFGLVCGFFVSDIDNNGELFLNKKKLVNIVEGLKNIFITEIISEMDIIRYQRLWKHKYKK